jgi:FlaG/FlaF family flagellin (archaellin)
LATWRANSDHHPSRADLALIMDTIPAGSAGGTTAVGNEASSSAVSWAAIIAGAFAALALTVVLTSLGAGLGLTTISAWPNSGASVTTFTISAGIGLIVVQWLSSAFGGFITGRLRTKWAGVHTHEVFFRDTAHGFLSWALTTIVGTVLLAAATSSIVGGGVRAASAVAGGAAQAVTSGISDYSVDSLFRSDHVDASTSNQEVAAQASRILANGVRNGDVPPGDRNYLAQLVATKTGIPQADAQKRVDDTIASTKEAEIKARQAVEATRKATATFAIFTALSLMIGAFVASAAAAFGGNIRDEY